MIDVQTGGGERLAAKLNDEDLFGTPIPHHSSTPTARTPPEAAAWTGGGPWTPKIVTIVHVPDQ